MTLQQALQQAASQNPDVLLARLDERRAHDDVIVAKSPFRPKVYGGSGLAYTYGYPNSIEGNAPSIFQVRTDMALFNRPDMYKLASAREGEHSAHFSAQAKAEDIAYQTADLFLTASDAEHEADTLGSEIPSLQKVAESATAAVEGGSELPLEEQRANVNLALSKQRLEAAKLDADYYEMLLAVALGYPATDRVKPLESNLANVQTPSSAAQASQIAVDNNRELKQMQAQVMAKQLDLRSYKSERLPQIDLVAQYALFDKQNYEQYFQKFQANNAQLGVAITIPLLVGPSGHGLADQAAVDMAKIRLQMEQTRNRIFSDTERAYQQYEKAKAIRDLTRMQLDLARETLTVLLAQNKEGRALMRDVENARLEETDKWIALFDADTQVTRAQLAILRQMGTLLSSVAGTPAPQP